LRHFAALLSVGLAFPAIASTAMAGTACYRVVTEPALYRTVEEKVLVAPEREISH
jgi:hypothetical protein